MTQLTKEELLEEFKIYVSIMRAQEHTANKDGEPEDFIDDQEGYTIANYTIYYENAEYFDTYEEALARQAEIVEIEFNKLTK